MTTWVLDLDGVLWRGDRLLPGAADAVADLLERGRRVVFCTNHAQAPEVKAARLADLGVAACPVVTAAEAAAASCAAGERVLVLGHGSLVRYLAECGLDAVDLAGLPDGRAVPDVDVVVVGAAHDWNRALVGLAADAVRSGARLLATNDDPTFPVSGPRGPRLLPGNGALVAAVATAAGVTAEVAGKPHAAMVELIRGRFGEVEVVVGDRPETDGRLADGLGSRFALVLSGVTAADRLPVVPPSWSVHPDLAAVVAADRTGADEV